jgi:hypothetical protein
MAWHPVPVARANAESDLDFVTLTRDLPNVGEKDMCLKSLIVLWRRERF